MKKISLFLIVVISTIILSNCNEDDESLSGSIVFWYDNVTSVNLINDGATSLTYYVDNKIVGSSAANIYFTSEPDCGQNGTITVEKNLGNNTSMSFPYKVIDDTGFEYWSGSVTFEANTCTTIELEF